MRPEAYQSHLLLRRPVRQELSARVRLMERAGGWNISVCREVAYPDGTKGHVRVVGSKKAQEPKA